MDHNDLAAYPASYAYANRECVPDTKFVTRPATSSQTELSTTDCAVSAPYGQSAYGLIALNSTHISGKTQLSGNDIPVLAIPGLNTVYRTYGSSGAAYQYFQFFDGLPYSLTTTVDTATKEVKYGLPSSPWTMRDLSSNQLTGNSNSVSFSNNGKWMVVDSPGSGAILRVNMLSHAILPFSTSFNYDLGYNPIVALGVSDDGRYAMVKSDNPAQFKMYDLDTCGTVPATISEPVSCEYKNLYSLYQANSIINSSTFKFIGDNAISFYGSYNDSGQVSHIAKFYMTAAGQPLTTLSLLGLGDSFSAGEGAYQYYSGTDTPENKCHLSKVSYPYLLGAALSSGAYKSVACSGAQTTDITQAPQYAYDTTHPLPSPNPLGNMLPGSQRQLDFVQLNRPDIITLTMGGNDIGFSDIIKRCTGAGIVADTCFDTYEDRLELVRQINGKFDVFTDTYTRLKSSSPANTKIYVAGYPSIAQDNGNCAANVRLNADEVKFSNLLIDYLNSVIHAAADRVGVRYVDISTALNGYRLCESTSSSAMNGLTSGDDMVVIGNESYHPNALGQRLMKSMFLIQTNGLTQAMPSANSNATYPAESPSLPILNVPTANRSIKSLLFESSIAPDILFSNTPKTIAVSGLEYALKAASSFSIELHSTPISLGTFTTNATGDLGASITIPGSVPTGYHTLHVYGQNLSGEDIDIYKTIYVAASASDFDGDSVPNSTDACVSIAPVNQDIDQDGIDDGCDGYINDAPADINALYRARNGIAANGEDTNEIYVERNTAKAASLLGVTDADNNSDGWVTVGKSSSSTNGTIAHFWIEDIGPQENKLDKYVPHISIRSTQHGCVQFKPSNLAAVTDTTTRDVVTEAENTSTCRSISPDADTDSNGVADNAQPLYRARNGNASVGEDANSVYIERNLAASEAILGISDYDDNNDGWAVIGKSSGINNGIYAHIALIDPTSGAVLSTTGSFTTAMLGLSDADRKSVIPVVSLTDSATACIGIEPSSLDFVTEGQNRTVSSTALPDGLSCS